MNGKSLWKGFLGSMVFSIICVFIWLIFSFFGQLGFWSAPAFGLLIPIGFKVFSKQKPIDVKSILLMFLALLISVAAAAYIGYVINVYAMLMNFGSAFEDIYISDVRGYIWNIFKDNVDYFAYDVFWETGIAVTASSLIGALLLIYYKKSNKEVK